MAQKREYVIGIVVIYVLLIVLYFIVKQEETIDLPCTYDNPCVRFCCSDTKDCNEDYFRKNFDATGLYSHHFFDMDENETSSYLILIGKPKCSMKLIVNESETETHEWQFYYVS